eukprot:CAMPEP_0184325438 /NCGR_PEP_ID=MMETSP1049-20130417/140299_1 /TAXON_ID=77928 /ORGANISM="Proteomonas sulcata, Strain CCMP704" /LENGTH=216 /DNA_ID=CAMNT_0026647483 /DNA_START=71 /DNA_END=721 /DNA_ORIENTATION=-
MILAAQPVEGVLSGSKFIDKKIQLAQVHQVVAIVGGACSVLHSLSTNPEARQKILERDGLKLMFGILATANTHSPDAVAGAAGCIQNFGRTRGQFALFAKMNGFRIVAKASTEIRQDAALYQIICLIAALAEVEEYRDSMIDEGVLRCTLKLLEQLDDIIEPTLEMVALVISIFAAEVKGKLHLQRLGAAAVLEEAFLMQNQDIKRCCKMALNRLA